MDEKIIENYIPAYNEFCFNFSRDECYFEENGICPVKKNKSKILNRIAYNTSCKCESLMQKIIENGFYERTKECEILVIRNEPCGKYIFSNGRHRTCAASILNMPIKIHISNDECHCMCDQAFKVLKRKEL